MVSALTLAPGPPAGLAGVAFALTSSGCHAQEERDRSGTGLYLWPLSRRVSGSRLAEPLAERTHGDDRAPHARKVTVAAFIAATVFGAPISGAAFAARAGTRSPAVTYTFRTLDNAKCRSFNQLLGINDHGKIAGCYGSGAQGHPNKGYLLAPPYGPSNYRAEDVPNAPQTQVSGLSTGVIVGFYCTTNKANPAANANFGFWSRNGHFHKVAFPARKASAGKSSPAVDQLLGVNHAGEAVGFYLDAGGNSHGYLYNIGTRRFVPIRLPGPASVTGTGINNKNAVVGFFNQSAGMVKAFYITQGTQSRVHVFAFPGADFTQAFGVNDHGEVVGAYTTGGQTFGFTWTVKGHFRKVNDPHGEGTTVINGVNNAGVLVGFFTSQNGSTHGMLAKP